MKLKLMSEDLEKFRSVNCLAIDDVLGILQNVGKDIKKETGQSMEEACVIRDPDKVMDLLIWTVKLYSRIYDANQKSLDGARRLAECQAVEAQLRNSLAQQEPYTQKIRELNEELDRMRATMDGYIRQKREYEELIAEKARLEEQVDAVQANARDLPSLRAMVTLLEDARRADILTAERDIMRGQGEEIRAKIDELEGDLKDLRDSELPALKMIYADKLHQKNTLQAEARQQSEAVESVKAETSKILNETARITRQKKDKEAEWLELTDRLNSAYGQAADMDEKVRSLREQISQLEDRLKGKSEDGLMKTLEARAAHLEDRKRKCADLEAQLTLMQRDVDMQEAALSEKEKSLTDLRERARVVDEALERCEKELGTLPRREEELKARRDRLAALKQIQQALDRQAAHLADIPEIGKYTAATRVDELLQNADNILSEIEKAIRQYVHATNKTLEEIK